MAQAAIFRLEGDNYSSRAYRTITGNDTSTIDVGDDAALTFMATVARRKVYGAGAIYLFAGHNHASGSIVVTPVFYDRDDNLLSIGAAYTLTSKIQRADLLKANGDAAANYYLTSMLDGISPPLGAYSLRLFVESLANSTEVLLYVAHDDNFLLTR